eukprot:1824386-Prymnesium_polylepis.1
MSEAPAEAPPAEAAAAPAVAVPQLSPKMEKPQLDHYLRAAFGVQSNPFTVEEIFSGARPMNSTAWVMISRLLGLDEIQSAQLILRVNNARTAPKAPAPAPPPREKAVISEADRNRAERLATAKPGEHTSIFGTDAAGRPLTKDGCVQEQASAWSSMLTFQKGGKLSADGVMESTPGSGLSLDKQNAAAKKKLRVDELTSLPSTTLRMPKPDTKKGCQWRSDIKWAHEHRQEIPAFLKAGIEEGARCRPWQTQQKLAQAKRNELDTFTSVDEVITAAAVEVLKITEKFKEANEEHNAKLVDITQQMAQKVNDPECLLSLAAKVSTIQAELAALPQAEADEKAASTAKFNELRDRVSKRVQDGAAPSMAPSQPRRQAP